MNDLYYDFSLLAYVFIVIDLGFFCSTYLESAKKMGSLGKNHLKLPKIWQNIDKRNCCQTCLLSIIHFMQIKRGLSNN